MLASAYTADLTFDELHHAYYLSGVRLPGFSEIVKACGQAQVYPEGDYNARGQAFHKATVLYDRGTLDIERLDHRIKPFFAGYPQFVEKWRPTYTMTEKALYHPTLMYCGTVDRVGLVGSEDWVWDFKTSDWTVDPITDLQTVAYALAAFYPDEGRARRAKRAAVRFSSDGRYKMYPYGDNDVAADAWKGMVAWYRWKTKG